MTLLMNILANVFNHLTGGGGSKGGLCAPRLCCSTAEDGSAAFVNVILLYPVTRQKHFPSTVFAHQPSIPDIPFLPPLLLLLAHAAPWQLGLMGKRSAPQKIHLQTGARDITMNRMTNDIVRQSTPKRATARQHSSS